MKFYSSIAPFYEAIFPLSMAQSNFVNRLFKQKYNAHLLDVGCGVGTLIQELDKDFENIYGFDIDAEMVAMAQSRKFIHDPKIVVANMLDISRIYTHEMLDGVICFGNTLVHLNNFDQVNVFIKGAFEVLNKGGKFVLQIINYDRIIKNMVTNLPTIDNRKINFIRDYEYLPNQNRIKFKTKLLIKENAQLIENEQLLIPIQSQEIIASMAKSGISTIETYGSFNFDRFTDDSYPLIIVATK